MGYLLRKIKEARKGKEEEKKVNSVVRIQVKAMDIMISMHRSFGGTPPSKSECTELEEKRIESLMSEFPSKASEALGREVLETENLYKEKSKELQASLDKRRGRLYQKYAGHVEKLEEQATSMLGDCVKALAAQKTEMEGLLPLKEEEINTEFEELIEDLKQEVESRYPKGVIGLDKYDDALPDGIPSWKDFLIQVDTTKQQLLEANKIAIEQEVSSIKLSTAILIRDKINAAIRASVEEVKLDLSDDVIPFLDDEATASLKKELIETTEAYAQRMITDE